MSTLSELSSLVPGTLHHPILLHHFRFNLLICRHFFRNWTFLFHRVMQAVIDAFDILSESFSGLVYRRSRNVFMTSLSPTASIPSYSLPRPVQVVCVCV